MTAAARIGVAVLATGRPPQYAPPVPPRYAWVGAFYHGRAAIRLGGLYGFVDSVQR